jgi:hypothetical protein
MSRVGSSLAKLLRFGAAALKPSKQSDGTWRQAAVSAKAAARLRKAALLEGRHVSSADRWPRCAGLTPVCVHACPPLIQMQGVAV